MRDKIISEIENLKEDIIKFTQELIQIRSCTGLEEEMAICVKNKMKELGYDKIDCDKLGNVIGTMGNGDKKIMFDSHMDTVSVNDESEWSVPPFEGRIIDGDIYGRGACDMKGAIAATVYTGYVLKKLNLLEGKTVYVSASVMEEDLDGNALEYILTEGGYKPDCVVICEPSELGLAIGHRGRAAFKINTHGVSAHGSTPEKGKNAVYMMSKVLERIERLSSEYMASNGKNGSIAVSRITSKAVSLCAIPDECTINIDRRLTVDEDFEYVSKELDKLIEGLDADWEVYIESGSTYTGEKVDLYTFLPAWEMPMDNEFVTNAISTHKNLRSEEPRVFKWNFSTNGVASAGKLKIPTIGYGPGSIKYAHARDERCPVDEIIKACEFYTMFVCKN